MNKKIKEIDEFINGQINEEDGSVIETDDFDGIYGLINFTNKKFDCKLEFIKVGGFDSPGYDVKCYAWAGIIDGELYLDSLQMERY